MVAGPSCLVAFLFLSIASRAFFPNFDLAFACHLPLTISNDVGLALAIGGCAFAMPRIQNVAQGYLFALCATGACLATLLKMGIIGGLSATTLIAGDALAAFFVATCLILWWKTLLEEVRRPLRRTLALIGLASSALFFPFALLPASVAGVAAAIALPLASCLCFEPFLSNKAAAKATPETAQERPRQTMPGIVAAIVVLSFFTVDPILDLFHTNQFYDGPATGSLCLPGALCMGICAAMSAIALFATKKRELPLAALYVPAFALAVVGFLLSPYRPINGIPLGAAESGRMLVCVFIMCIVMKVSKGDPRTTFALSLKTALLACLVVLACDVVVIAMQLMPGFDYADFVFRTTFSAVCIAMLVVLLLGPLPRLEVSLSAMDAEKNAGDETAAPQPTVDPTAQREQLVTNFAQAHGLTARETEVFALIAAGRDVPYIERELVLAKSTVKTHVKHIYAKCDVSSKQDLLDMLEEFSK